MHDIESDPRWGWLGLACETRFPVPYIPIYQLCLTGNDTDSPKILKIFCFHTPEEEPQCRGASGDGEGESVFVGVGTSILTTRSCEPKDGRQPTDNHKRPPRRPLSVQECEVFLPVTEQVM